jgi:Bacillus/Clostridium GerA spore germination protein.
MLSGINSLVNTKVIGMNSNTSSLEEYLNLLLGELGQIDKVIVKKIIIGKGKTVRAAIIYVNGIVNRDIIDRDVLKALMTNVEDNILEFEKPCEYLCERYIYMSETYVEKDIHKVVENIKKGKTAIAIDGVSDFILLDTCKSISKDDSEPVTESAIRGSREGFVENLNVNIGMLRKRIKDKNLFVETFTVGTRTQTDLALVYMDDIVDKDIINEIRNRINKINVDSVQGIGIIEQLIEKYPYTFFPQVLTTERPDRVIGNIMEGRMALILDGTPFVMVVPVIITDFFQAVEDYYERTLISSFIRILRIMAVIIIITLPSIYLIFIRFNAELIPVKFIVPIIQARKGIPLPPLLEILSMEIVIEFLREGGLRLPGKIGQTLSVVGGFIIGDAAIRARIVSPATIVVVGAAVIGTFIIPNYEMSLSIRLIRFPMLILSNILGILGLVAGVYLLMVHLYSLESFGVPYAFTNKYSDLKDTVVRVPIWKMNKRPQSIPNNNPVRQTDFKEKSGGKNNEEGK